MISLQAKEMPQVTKVWPLFIAVGASVVAWTLQGVVSALLARPQLGSLRVLDMTRIYLAGAFIGGISPIRGAEIPYEIYLLRRLGLSAGEGGTVVVTRGLLNVIVLTAGAVGGLIFSSKLPKIESGHLLLAVLGLGVIWATASFLIRRRAKRAARQVETTGWRASIRNFFQDMRRSFALLLRPEQRGIMIASVLVMIVYWAFRLSLGSLAMMAAGWSGDWVPVVLAQLFLSSFILPLAPTPGGSGATELGFAALLSAYATNSQLLSAVIIYAGLTHYLPTAVGAFFTGRQLWQGAASDE